MPLAKSVTSPVVSNFNIIFLAFSFPPDILLLSFCWFLETYWTSDYPLFRYSIMEITHFPHYPIPLSKVPPRVLELLFQDLVVFQTSWTHWRFFSYSLALEMYYFLDLIGLVFLGLAFHPHHSIGVHLHNSFSVKGKMNKKKTWELNARKYRSKPISFNIWMCHPSVI